MHVYRLLVGRTLPAEGIFKRENKALGEQSPRGTKPWGNKALKEQSPGGTKPWGNKALREQSPKGLFP